MLAAGSHLAKDESEDEKEQDHDVGCETWASSILFSPGWPAVRLDKMTQALRQVADPRPRQDEYMDCLGYDVREQTG
jgi:hypothetical protein